MSNPVAMADRTYKVTLDIVTKDENGNTKQSPGESVDIAKKDSDEFSDNFDGLDANSYYILRAKPNNGYLSNWKIGDPSAEGVEKTYGLKTIYTSKMNTNVEVEFNKIKTYCIKVNTNDIDNIGANLYKNCKYKSESGGEYVVESVTLGIYKYVGAPNGTHNYSCDEDPEFFTEYANYIEVCGLKPGDYKVEINPTDGYTIDPDNESSTYTQNIRLGTSDNEFNITVSPVSED